jgi:hypothetical protein
MRIAGAVSPVITKPTTGGGNLSNNLHGLGGVVFRGFWGILAV